MATPMDPARLRTLGADVRRATALTERLNRTPYDDTEALRALWGELTGRPVDPDFHLIPPVWSDYGLGLRIGRRVFVNQNCRLNDLGGIELGDDVMLGPDVKLISSGHSTVPVLRKRQVTADPIRIGTGVWIGTGATVLQGVTVGDHAVIAAGAVVTRDVPAGMLVAGVPARVIGPVDEPGS